MNMFPQTPLYLFLQLIMEQLVHLLRHEADAEEYVCHCQYYNNYNNNIIDP